jgi:hypothetical protein
VGFLIFNLAYIFVPVSVLKGVHSLFVVILDVAHLGSIAHSIHLSSGHLDVVEFKGIIYLT